MRASIERRGRERQEHGDAARGSDFYKSLIDRGRAAPYALFMKRASLLASFLFLPVVAASPEPQAEMRVTDAIVFKNGLAFITRQGALAFRNGEASVTPAPDALLGTLWVAAGDRRIDVVRALNEDAQTESDVTSMDALLDANAGRTVNLFVYDDAYTGTLLPSPAQVVLVKIDGKVHAFPRSGVASIAFTEPPSLKTSQSQPRTKLSIQAKGADASEMVTMRYLRNGLSWIPDYTIELLDDERARVAMRATLMNDGEDLRDARIRFAVGYPNFSFAGVPSPMTLQQTVEQFIGTLSGSVFSGRAFSLNNRIDNVMTQVAMNAPTAAQSDPDQVLPGAPVTGESAEDLFFYEVNAVTLAKGERGLYPILTEVVPFRHVYQWTIDGVGPEEVWHSVSLSNRGTTPWTTAPALIVSNGKPLAQDTLGYTAAGSRGAVKLTIATDVAVERNETEIERKPRDLERAGYVYDGVIIEGTLTVRSFKRNAITLDITKTIEGQVVQRESEVKVTRLAAQPRAVNPQEKLEWQIAVPAGEKRTVKYRYKLWVRE